MQILFEDDYIVVAVKPQGIISQLDSSGKESFVSLLEEETKGQIFPVHRLDKETGGVMVYAKNSFSAGELSKQISEHKFEKKYLAVIHGVMSERSAKLTDLLFKDSAKNKTYVVKRERRGVKKAVLSYETLKTTEDGKNSLVSVNLETGRTHQIRVQFSSRRHPLLGDKKYGAADNFKNIGLWSQKISFNHPKTHERLEFESEPQSEAFEIFE